MAKKTTKKTTRKKTAKKASAMKPRMSASAARADGEAKVKRALAETKAARVDGGALAERARASHREAKGNAKSKPTKRVSLLDAAATVLASAKQPMQAKAIVEQVVKRGLWKPGEGKTPHATLYAAMTREISKKGKDARFEKIDRGLFKAA